jgi:hypothetical protein
MKSKILLFVFAAVLLGSAPSAFSQTNDDGILDTLILLATRPAVGADDSSFIVEMYYWGDLDTVVGFSIGYRWDNPNVTLDSAFLSPEALASFDLVHQVYFHNLVEETNDSMMIVCQLARILAGGIIMDSQRHLLATYYFSLSSWTGADQVVFDSSIGSLTAGVNNIVNDYAGTDWTPIMPSLFYIQDPSDAGDQGSLDIPADFALAQNYPNPFNPTTSIGFSLPIRANVALNVYNLLGQQVRTLLDKEMDAGTHSVEWDGTNDAGGKVASGVYFYKLTTGDFVETRKMMLLK